MSKKPTESLPTILPVLKATHIDARSIDIVWTYADRDPRYVFSNLSYQLSRAEEETLKFEVVYEGEEPLFTIRDLKPTTNYKIKLRIAFTKNLTQQDTDSIWSKTYSELDVATIAETQAVKTTAAFLKAITTGDVNKATAIIKESRQDISLEARDKSGKTLLMLAAQAGFADIVQILLKNGADVSATTQSGKTALSFAISMGSLKSAEAILKHDPQQASIADIGGSTPLMWAAENANLKHGVAIIGLLVQHGADVNHVDPRGYTAFDRLCSTCGNVKAATLLVEQGANIIKEIDKGHPTTSLMTAALNGHRELVKALMDKWGCDPLVETEHGGTAKSFAESNGHRLIADLIAQKIAEMHHENEETQEYVFSSIATGSGVTSRLPREFFYSTVSCRRQTTVRVLLSATVKEKMLKILYMSAVKKVLVDKSVAERKVSMLIIEVGQVWRVCWISTRT
ncbi:ankyrin repeat-containing domain protein [Gorgonomyces haynaldii]|nr:ankyrin repeat-containing domain protein [Gorgonomyces haynaldii]